MSDKLKIILSVFVIFLISTIGVIAYQSKDKIDLQKIIYENTGGSNRKNFLRGSNLYVECVVLTSIDKKTLRLKVHIPCRSKVQKSDLQEKIPKIQHGFIMAMSGADMQELVKKRDFSSLKIRFLSIINAFSSSPVTNLYFENYFLG